jgi:hypothetical protein
MKMKKLLTVILIILPMLIWAHQDSYYTYKYGNVTVRFKTGFFFEEINNAKIIGKYAALLSDSMGYDKPILLDFIHDYGHSYEGKTFSFLSYGSQNYDLVSYYMPDSLEANLRHMVPLTDTIESMENVEKEINTVTTENRQQAIVIRQFGFHFDLTQTMNLLFYAIINKHEVKKRSNSDTLLSYLRNTYYSFESIPRDIIDSIKASKSTVVESVLKTKVYCEVESISRNQLYYSYFSQNGTYQIFASIHDKEILLDTVKRVYSLNPWESIYEVLFVFESPNQMRSYSVMTFFGNEVKRSKKHRIEIDPYEYIRSINVDWFGDDIFIIDYSNGFGWTPVKRLIYLKKDDVIISDFEEYINSHRKEENRNSR